MAFEMLHVLENKFLRLARWVITLYLSVRISSFEVTPHNVIIIFAGRQKEPIRSS